MCLPFGPTISTTSSSSSSASTPRPTPTERASSPSFAEPTSSPSASCTRGGNASSSRPTWSRDTVFTAVPPFDLRRIAHHAPKRSGRARRDRRPTNFYEPRDNLLEVPPIASGISQVRLSSADRVLFPEDGITKGDLFAYYERVASVLVPHLRDRPFTMKRYREGIRGEGFFQKQAPKGMPAWIETRRFTTHPREGGAREV